MNETGTILDKIVAAKKAGLAKQKEQKSLELLQAEAAEFQADADIPGFFDAIKAPGARPKIIAEVKRASPSAGTLREDFSLEEINDAYQGSDRVAAISVITETDHFQGSADTLAYFASHNVNHKPLLRKDFIFDRYQILEAKLLGAQAYLLITALFDTPELAELVDFGLKHGLEPLVEVHDQEELDRSLQTGARCIGVNCRDLRDFTIDKSRHQLLRKLDNSYARIAESAIDTPEYLNETAEYADAVLIGTEFMKAKNVAASIAALEGKQ